MHFKGYTTSYSDCKNKVSVSGVCQRPTRQNMHTYVCNLCKILAPAVGRIFILSKAVLPPSRGKRYINVLFPLLKEYATKITNNWKAQKKLGFKQVLLLAWTPFLCSMNIWEFFAETRYSVKSSTGKYFTVHLEISIVCSFEREKKVHFKSDVHKKFVQLSPNYFAAIGQGYIVL